MALRDLVLATGLMSLGLLLDCANNRANAASVESFSPQGSSKQVRQVRATFDAPMVALGDPRSHVSPFEIQCPEKFTTRWADPQNWILDFARDLPAGVKCTFKTKTNVKDIKGAALGEASFAFTAGGPIVTSYLPSEYENVSSDQAFVLTLDGSVDEQSLSKGVFISADGVTERIPVSVVTGKDREAILKSLADRWEFSRDEKDKSKAPVRVIVQPLRALPEGAKVVLHWTKDVRSKEGAAVVDSQTLNWTVEPSFEAKFNCERENVNAACSPITAMTLSFTAPVSIDVLKKIRLTSSSGKTFQAADFDKAKKRGEKEMSRLEFRGPFPERQKFTLALPKDFRDERGRALVNVKKFPLETATAAYPPLAKFASNFGIYEALAEPALPLSVRNIEAQVSTEKLSLEGKSLALTSEADYATVIGWMRRVLSKADDFDSRDKPLFTDATSSGRKREAFQAFSIPKPNGPREFELIGIPLPKTGFHVVEVSSLALGTSLLGSNKKMYVAAGALVTNLSVHTKLGRENSMIWVTELNTGKPVAGARVSVRTCSGSEVASGTTKADGTAVLEGLSASKAPGCSDDLAYGSGYFTFAKKGDDFSFAHSSWSEGLEPWRFGVNYDGGGDWGGRAWRPLVAHGVFDRMLYRAGETLHLKSILRDHTMSGFGPYSKALPTKIVFRHAGSGETFEFPTQWDKASGVSEIAWSIPKSAKLGTYTVTLSSKPLKAAKVETPDQTPEDSSDSDWNQFDLGTFRVAEYRIPLMKAIVKLPSDAQVRPKTIPVDLSAQYLAGGGARNLPVKLRYQFLKSAAIDFSDFPGFNFSQGEVKEQKASRRDRAREDREPPIETKSLKLDSTGSLRTSIEGLPPIQRPTRLSAEMEFTDPNGEVQTVAAQTTLLPSKRLVGVKTESWLVADKALDVDAVVVDERGKPVSGAPVEFEAFSNNYFSHRKRLVGGFYAYENVVEIKRIGILCKATTDDKGRAKCTVKAPQSGELLVQAKTSDEAGHSDATSASVTVVQPGEYDWMPQADSDRIDFVPERKRYEPKETARFQLKMPFKEGTALVTVEREGIIDSFVVPITRDVPLIEIPIKDNYAPNVFVSAIVVRGRVADSKPTALVDLARPALKMGLGEIKVGWGARELNVNVKADKDVYRVREKAKVAIKVTRGPNAGSGALPSVAEVAVAAVDEGLLELQPNSSWNLLKGMMDERPLEVFSSTAQLQVVGKRHFGLKARPPGGDGGARSARELFDTLLLWRGRVSLDKNGEAVVEVPLNDSLTSFRIVAVAQAGWDLFGTGETKIRATKDLMLFSGIAPLVREGDRIDSSFTVRNSTEKELTVKLSATIKAGPNPVAVTLPPDAQALKLAAGESKIVALPVTVPVDVETLVYEVRADAGSGIEDSIKVTSKVAKAVPERVLQSTITQLEKTLSVPVERPKDAVPGRGGLTVIAQAKLGRGLDGVKRYMREYSYICLEQKTSRAIALEDASALKSVIEELPAYMDGDGLLRYFTLESEGSDILTSYVVSILHEAGAKVPDDIRARLQTALTRFVKGEITRAKPWLTTWDPMRKIAALEALSRLSPVTNDLLQSIEIKPNLWPTSTVIAWANVLSRSRDLAARDVRIKEAEQVLRTRLNFQGTTMGFSDPVKWQDWYLMSSTDTNAVRLLLLAVDDKKWHKDISRLVRGALLRQKRAAWDLTTANAWGTLALKKFSSVFEKDPVSGVTVAVVGSTRVIVDWSKTPEGTKHKLGWPEPAPASKGASAPSKLELKQEGSGRPWVTVQASAALPLKSALVSGYTIKKTLEPIEQRVKNKWHVGDLVRVRLEVDAQADQSWVVVSDPVPAGATILGSGLGRQSAMMNKASGKENDAWPAFQERSFEAFRSYYDYLYKGKFSTEYAMRLNSSGRMQLPPTRVEAMYAPEAFGEIPNTTLDIGK